MKTREKVKLFFLFIFYCVITQQVFAQKRTISGTVTSADEKEALIAIVSKIIFRSKNIVRPISQLVEKQMNYS